MGRGGSERHECRNTGDNFYLLFFLRTSSVTYAGKKKTIYYIQSLAEVSGPRFKLFPSPPKIVQNCDCLRNDEKKTTRRHFFFPKVKSCLGECECILSVFRRYRQTGRTRAAKKTDSVDPSWNV